MAGVRRHDACGVAAFARTSLARGDAGLCEHAGCRCAVISQQRDGASDELGLLPPPLAAELGFTRVRPLYELAEVGNIRLRLEGWGEGGRARSCPLPVPPPQAGEGTMWPQSANVSR